MRKTNRMLYYMSVFCEMDGLFSNGTNQPMNIGKKVISIAFRTDGIMVTSMEAMESQMLQIMPVWTVPNVQPAVAWQTLKKSSYQLSYLPLIRPISSVTP